MMTIVALRIKIIWSDSWTANEDAAYIKLMDRFATSKDESEHFNQVGVGHANDNWSYFGRYLRIEDIYCAIVRYYFLD